MSKKNIIITGASRGIGKELAIQYAGLGNQVMMIARSEDDLKKISEELNKSGKHADYIPCDVSIREEMINAIKQTSELFGSIDIAILNAGIGMDNKMIQFDAAKFQKVFDVNLIGIAYAMEELIKIMKSRRKGTIAGVGSLADGFGLPGSASYAASKIALSHFMQAARIELRPYNINVITIKPGFVRTDMTANNKYPMPFIMDANKAAKLIIKKINAGKKRIDFPAIPAFSNYIAKVLPAFFVEWLLNNWKRKSEKYEK